MKRLIGILFCCAALNARAQQPPTAGEPPRPRPTYRCLILVDTSSAMARQKEVTTDTVSKLILGGFGGRLRAGDAWSIWTFDEQLRTNSIPPQTWDARQRRDVATRAYRFLNEQRFKKKKAVLDKAVAAINDEAQRSGELIVFLITDGGRPVKGTPFDKPINEIFSKHASAMRKVKKPFVTVLVAQEGRFSDQAVSPGGGPIYIPRLAGAPAPAETRTNADAAATATNNAAQRSKKPLSVEEISAALRQSQKLQTNPVAAAPAPLILRGTNSNGSAAQAADKPVSIASVTNHDAALVPPDARAPQSPLTAGTNAPAVSSAVPAGAGQTRSNVVSTNVATNAILAVPAGDTNVLAPRTNDSAVAAAPDARDDVEESTGSPAAWPQTAALVQPDAASNAWKYLAAAGALLLAAMTLGWLYVRSIRYVPRPSLISQSLDKEKVEDKSLGKT